MDTPRPVTETMKEIKILSDKNKEYLFLIKIISSDIEITIESINEIPNNSYKNTYSFKQLFVINKYFKLCEKIEEAFQVIVDNINSNNYELKQLNNALSLIIITNDKLCGNFDFEIPIKIKSEREDINEIYNHINRLKLENLKLSEEKKEMEKKFN